MICWYYTCVGRKLAPHSACKHTKAFSVFKQECLDLEFKIGGPFLKRKARVVNVCCLGNRKGPLWAVTADKAGDAQGTLHPPSVPPGSLPSPPASFPVAKVHSAIELLSNSGRWRDGRFLEARGWNPTDLSLRRTFCFKDRPGTSLVVKTLCFQCRVCGFNSWSGN